MGLRLEFILSLFIVVIVISILMLKLTPSLSQYQPLKKELEFTDTTFTEVNNKQLAWHLYSRYGVQYQGVLALKKMQYTSETIHYLEADKATYKNKILYLYGHVLLTEENGYRYLTEQANYNQKSEMFYITAPFVGIKDKNRIKGDTLVYNTREKKAYGTTIASVLYTADK